MDRGGTKRLIKIIKREKQFQEQSDIGVFECFFYPHWSYYWPILLFFLFRFFVGLGFFSWESLSVFVDEAGVTFRCRWLSFGGLASSEFRFGRLGAFCEFFDLRSQLLDLVFHVLDFGSIRLSWTRDVERSEREKKLTSAQELLHVRNGILWLVWLFVKSYQELGQLVKNTRAVWRTLNLFKWNKCALPRYFRYSSRFTSGFFVSGIASENESNVTQN